MDRISWPLPVLLCLAVLLASCSSPPTQSATTPDAPDIVSTASTGRLTVFAAASLMGAFKEIGTSYEATYPGTLVAFSFAGSQDLRTQIEQGAKADVFASADSKSMELLKTENLLANDPQVFAHNVLAVIIPKANPAELKGLTDLTRPGLKIVLADTSVPAGDYSLQILDKLSADPTYGADFKTKVLANVVSNETDVKAVVSKVSLGEADAGVVYTTDAQVAADKLTSIPIPDRFNVIATYPLVVLKGSPNAAQARQFVSYVLSSEGQAILKKYGFTSR